MLKDVTNRVAVITGGASGIGRALAEGLAREGMRVIVGDIDVAGAEETANSLGTPSKALAVDVADGDSVANFAAASFDLFGQVDLLVNNAGVFQGGLCWERSAEDWEWTLGVNLYGIIHAIRSFVPRMIAQDTDGHVVNTASVAAFVAGPTSAPYVVSKCAALSISECLALDLRAVGSKIGASVLTPSTFETGIATTARVRPERFRSDTTPDGHGTALALGDIIAKGRAPELAVAPVLEAVRSGTFLIPTQPSYAAQLKNRYDALLERRLPELVDVD